MLSFGWEVWRPLLYTMPIHCTLLCTRVYTVHSSKTKDHSFHFIPQHEPYLCCDNRQETTKTVIIMPCNLIWGYFWRKSVSSARSAWCPQATQEWWWSPGGQMSPNSNMEFCQIVAGATIGELWKSHRLFGTLSWRHPSNCTDPCFVSLMHICCK